VHVHELSYRFPGQRHDVLKDIELDIAPGHKVCVAGFNGAGKSLLLQMIAGLYTNYEGSVAYNKIPLGNLNVADLRSFMGDSLAKEDIFRGTLEENISMGRPQVPFSEVREVSHAVGLENFVEEMEKGYQTMLDPEGRRLPNSIRQKIMLARAVAGSPRLILLEDTFMRLEVADRQRFADYLFSRGWTIVAVSNDAQFASRCDRVIVLDNGRVLHCGTYEEIKAKPEISKVFTVSKQS
jgi:ABC-type bacteriocin/lantibiotic exporter with double-glycine peptidase domain